MHILNLFSVGEMVNSSVHSLIYIHGPCSVPQNLCLILLSLHAEDGLEFLMHSPEYKHLIFFEHLRYFCGWSTFLSHYHYLARFRSYLQQDPLSTLLLRSAQILDN